MMRRTGGRTGPRHRRADRRDACVRPQGGGGACPPAERDQARRSACRCRRDPPGCGGDPGRQCRRVVLGQAGGLTPALLDRLRRDPDRLAAIAAGVEVVAGLDDALGRVIGRPNGLALSRVRMPIGVIGIIYEAARTSPPTRRLVRDERQRRNSARRHGGGSEQPRARRRPDARVGGRRIARPCGAAGRQYRPRGRERDAGLSEGIGMKTGCLHARDPVALEGLRHIDGWQGGQAKCGVDAIRRKA